MRHEWLDQKIFETIEEAQGQATKWHIRSFTQTNGVHDLILNNNDPPNMAIGGITPSRDFATAKQRLAKDKLRSCIKPIKTQTPDVDHRAH